ncbi:Uncharacterised protein [Clostridioides difficile]|nr:Uncharacterised protein [Clostridioides difficile]
MGNRVREQFERRRGPQFWVYRPVVGRPTVGATMRTRGACGVGDVSDAPIEKGMDQ